MTKQKSTKKTLLTCVLSLVLCMAMLVGTTFAWFTDSVTSSNNKIQAGNLDVQLLMYDGTEYADISNSTSPIFGAGSVAQNVNGETLWEPGKTQVAYLAIKNNGSLDLKYTVALDVKNVTKNLDKAMQYTITAGAKNNSSTPWDSAKAKTVALGIQTVSESDVALKAGETHYFALSVHMMENAGNEYQDGTIDFDMTVLATQLASEYDSFDNQYDKDASTEDVILAHGGVITFTEDKNDAMTVAEDAVVTLNLDNYTLNNSLTNNGEVTVNGGTIDVEKAGLENYGNATLTDVEMNAGSSADYSNISKAGSVTVYNNVTIDSAGGGIGATDGANVTFNDGSVAVNSKSTSGRYLFYAVGEGTVVTINGGEFSFSKTLNQKRAYIYAGEGATVYVNGGTFGKASTRSGYTTGILGDGDVIIKGGTFGFDPTQWVADGYEATKDNGVWTVSPAVKNNTDLDEAIKAGKDVIALAEGTYIIPDSAQGKNLTIVGNGETVIATQDDGSYEGCDYSLDGSTVTFENITINTDSSTYTGYARLNATYNNCIINGTYTLYGNSVFNNCTFNVSGDVYNIWTWGAPNATFKKCTFNSDGKALLLYGTENTNLTVNDCVFNDNGSLTDLKAAIEIGNDYGKSYTLTVNNTTVNGYEINDKGISTGTTLWANKNSMGTDKLNVVIDGVDVY